VLRELRRINAALDRVEKLLARQNRYLRSLATGRPLGENELIEEEPIMSITDEERRAHMRDKHNPDVGLRDWWNLTKKIARLFHKRKAHTSPAAPTAWERVGYTDDGREIELNTLTGSYRIKTAKDEQC
jgi:hypothetical protein